MQTFLPYPDFKASAKCLDRLRLNKQRIECCQLLNALINQGGWKNHPAAKMWLGFEPSLCDYGIAICDEWTDRGYKDTYTRPSWLGTTAFHLAHQSNLVRKLPSHYRQFFPTVPDNLPYVWPIR